MFQAIAIGGSAGSFPVVVGILRSIPENTSMAVLLCLHRMKQVRSGFREILEANSNIPIQEPDDKTIIKSGFAYLAPANYHMLIERDFRISLSTDDPVNHSRPSIDLCFATAADTYGKTLIGILLSGANKDGTQGMSALRKQGSYCIIQDPDNCEIRTMCASALNIMTPDKLLSADQIIEFVSLLKK